MNLLTNTKKENKMADQGQKVTRLVGVVFQELENYSMHLKMLIRDRKVMLISPKGDVNYLINKKH